jgi:hypothetical protein
MMLSELISDLQDIADEHDEDLEVRLAIQPNWPFEHSLSQIALVEGEDESDEEFDDDDERNDRPENDKPSKTIVYLAEGRQLGYLPGAATHALDWEGRR